MTRQFRHTFLSLLLAALIIAVAGCSDKNTFTITGNTSDGREMTLRLAKYSPAGITTEVIATPSGRFEYSSPLTTGERPTYIEIYSNDYSLLGLLAVTPGTKYDLTVDPTGIHGYRINSLTSQEDSTSFNAALNTWLLNTDVIDNETISRFVKEYPYNAAAYAVLSNLYDATSDLTGAYALLNELTPEARPAYYENGFGFILSNRSETPGVSAIVPDTLLCAVDTFFVLTPEKYKTILIAFTPEGAVRTDSVVPLLRHAAGYTKKDSVLALEHNLSPDTLTWRRALREDARRPKEDKDKKTSGKKPANQDKKFTVRKIEDKNEGEPVNWVSVWSGIGAGAPGIDNYPVTQLPFFIVGNADTILYSGPSAAAARNALPARK